MRRSNLFRSVREGGVGLQHLFVKQLIMRLFFFRQCRHPLLRTVLQSVGLEYLPDITVSTMSHTGLLSAFYREVMQSVRFLLTRYSCDYLFQVSKRKLKADLLDSLFPVPVYRNIPSEWPGKDILSRLKKMAIRPAVKTFFFKVHTNTLPVKAWLAEKGIFVPWSVNCRYCREPETLEHVFLYCTEAQFMWDDLSRAIGKRLRLNPHTMRFLPIADKNEPRYDVLCVVAMHSLWRVLIASRNEEPVRPPMEHLKQELEQMRSMEQYRQEVPDWLQSFCSRLSPRRDSVL